MTPTLCTGSSTAKLCHSLAYQPSRFTSSATIASARRSRSSRGRRHLAEDPHGEARAGKRLPDDELLVEPELAADRAHFVLEQLAQRLDELHPHALGQAADVVVALDERRLPDDRHRLDHVGIQGALRQKVDAPQLGRFLLEHVDEGRADDLALLLGIGDAGEPIEEQRRTRRRTPAAASAARTAAGSAAPRRAAGRRCPRRCRSACRRSRDG